MIYQRHLFQFFSLFHFKLNLPNWVRALLIRWRMMVLKFLFQYFNSFLFDLHRKKEEWHRAKSSCQNSFSIIFIVFVVWTVSSLEGNDAQNLFPEKKLLREIYILKFCFFFFLLFVFWNTWLAVCISFQGCVVLFFFLLALNSFRNGVVVHPSLF